jgi:uncharacterized protein (DUF305 family)
VAASRRTVAVVAAAVVVALLGVVAFWYGRDSNDSGGDDADVRVVQPGAPGESVQELSSGDLAAIEAPRHNAADTAFMQHMIVHHSQAVQMAALVDTHTESGDLSLLAERIAVSQEGEIGLISRWLAERREPLVPADHDDHELMPGMATPGQMAELDAARGAAFDALFLELMITHHQGALAMVEQLYASGGGLEPAVDDFARDVEADQSIEIARMTDMLTAGGS